MDSNNKDVIDDLDSESYLTPAGAARLRAELESLQHDRKPRVTAWLQEVFSEGVDDQDSTEAEKASAEFWLIDQRINQLERLLGTSQILESPPTSDRVQLGSEVTVVEGDQAPETYRVVSSAEADPAQGFISNQSPLGRALLGRSIGDVISIKSPEGPIEFRLVAVR